jgi:aminoglycoside phosphotransferase (APT) family kinase protein
MLIRSGLAASALLAANMARLDGGSWFEPADLVVSGVQRTATGVAIVALSADSGPPAAIVKLALTDAARDRLELETKILQALHADDRLDHWRKLIPQPIGAGTFRGKRYRVDGPLEGGSVTNSLGSRRFRRAVLHEAADALGVLHGATAQTLAGGPNLGRKWVTVHVRELSRVTGRDPRLRLALGRLRDELYGVLGDGVFDASRVHGDYWPGNLLFSRVASPRLALSGIVDWDASGAAESPLHDVLHLALYTTRLTSGRELGEIVSERLCGPEWSADERDVFTSYAGPAWEQLSDRHALLLYWLRQMSLHIRQQATIGGWRLMLWQRRNVRPVLESL